MTAREDVRVLRSKDELKITYRWFWPGDIAVFAISSLCTLGAGTVLILMLLEASGVWQLSELLISLLLLVSGAGVAYYALGKAFNFTELCINRSTITIQAKPLPGSIKRIIPAEWVWDVFRTEYSPHPESENTSAEMVSSPTSLYRLNVLLTNGCKVCLLNDIQQAENASQMVDSIDRFLKETRQEEAPALASDALMLV